MRKSIKQKGFTLIEILSTLSIISVFLAISTFSAGCAINNTRLSESKVTAVTIQSSISNYYNANDVIPVTGTAVTVLGNDVRKLAKASIVSPTNPSKDLVAEMLSKGVLRKIDTSKIRFSATITDADVSRFYVVYVTEAQLAADPTLLELSRYNSTLVLGEVMTSCVDDSFVVEVGKKTYSEVSESIKYDVDNKYIDCPNPDLCTKLKNN